MTYKPLRFLSVLVLSGLVWVGLLTFAATLKAWSVWTILFFFMNPIFISAVWEGSSMAKSTSTDFGRLAAWILAVKITLLFLPLYVACVDAAFFFSFGEPFIADLVSKLHSDKLGQILLGFILIFFTLLLLINRIGYAIGFKRIRRLQVLRPKDYPVVPM